MEDLENPGGKPERRTLDLSLTQVAASALAAVVGAVLASQLGVYGTMLGAAVVSVGATTGTAVLQHLFRRTGEQLRGRATTPPPIEQPRRAREPVAAQEAQVFDPFDPGGERTRMMARICPPEQVEAVAVYRGRTGLKPRNWKVYAITATVVFALAMGTVGVIELASGRPAVNFFGGGASDAEPNGGTSAPVDPSPRASTGHSPGGSGAEQGRIGASPVPGASSGPQPSTSASATPTPAPATPTPHASTGSGEPGAVATPGASGAAATSQRAPSP